jgi:hypothetical protein
MKTKLGASLVAALMMMGMFGVSQATAEPGPNGKNDKGLCTAYFNGQKAGHDTNDDGRTDNARAFQGLEVAAGVLAETMPEDVADLIFAWCSSEAGADTDGDGVGDGVIIGGNPNENGRYVCDADGADDTAGTDDDYTCSTAEPKDNGKP